MFLHPIATRYWPEPLLQVAHPPFCTIPAEQLYGVAKVGVAWKREMLLANMTAGIAKVANLPLRVNFVLLVES